VFFSDDEHDNTDNVGVVVVVVS